MIDSDGNEMFNEPIEDYSETIYTQSSNAYHFSQAAVNDYYQSNNLEVITEEQPQNISNYPLGMNHRVKVILENNDCFKQRNLCDANFQKFQLYTDNELGIESAIFDKNLVDSVSFVIL